MVSRCRAANAEGASCQAQPVRPSGYCYWHDPALAEERDRKRREGGSNRSNAKRARRQMPAEPLSNAELAAWLTVSFAKAMKGQMAPALLNALSNAAKVMSELTRVSEMEERMAEIERKLGRKVS